MGAWFGGMLVKKQGEQRLVHDSSPGLALHPSCIQEPGRNRWEPSGAGTWARPAFDLGLSLVLLLLLLVRPVGGTGEALTVETLVVRQRHYDPSPGRVSQVERTGPQVVFRKKPLAEEGGGVAEQPGRPGGTDEPFVEHVDGPYRQ